MKHPPLLRPTEELAEFLARSPSADEIAAFRLSNSSVGRVRTLLARSAGGTLSHEEREELDQLALLDRIMMLIRSRLPQPPQHGETGGAPA